MKRSLGERVNFHCSVCDAPTLGAKTGTNDERFSVGKAAHIKAAAKRGPRYDPEQTPEERASIDNGIWACATCGDVIDRDAAAYSVDELLHIKSDAEWLSTSRAGRPPGSDWPVLKTPTAIQRAIDVYSRHETVRYERLDPRFKVKVRMNNGGTTYEVAAKERVDAKLVVAEKDRAKNAALLRDFFEYGGKVELDGDAIHMEGSALFETRETPANRWMFSSNPKPISLTIELRPTSGPTLFLEFHGTGSQGNKGVRLEGSAFDGILTVAITADYRGDDSSLRLNTDLTSWAKKPIRKLTNFSRLQQLLDVLASPVEAHIHWTRDGIESSSGYVVLDGSELLASTRGIVGELQALRKLDAFFDLNLVLPSEINDILWSRCDMDWPLGLIELAVNRETEISMTTVPTEEDLSMHKTISQAEPGEIVLHHRLDFDIHGQSYGPFNVEVFCPQAIVNVRGPARLSVGIPVDLIFRASEGYHWTSRLVPQTP